MKAKEITKELALKSESELRRELAQKREHVRDLRFKSSQNQLKEVRHIRETKKAIAKIMTVLTKKKAETTK